MSNFLTHLKLANHSKNNRWIVKLDKDNFVREVKLIFNPKEYRQINGSKELLTREKLIKVLELDKDKREALANECK